MLRPCGNWPSGFQCGPDWVERLNTGEREKIGDNYWARTPEIYAPVSEAMPGPGRPFRPGNPWRFREGNRGRPPGARGRWTLIRALKHIVLSPDPKPRLRRPRKPPKYLDPMWRDAKTGQFLPGHPNIGGRPLGAKDKGGPGVRALRKAIKRLWGGREDGIARLIPGAPRWLGPFTTGCEKTKQKSSARFWEAI